MLMLETLEYSLMVVCTPLSYYLKARHVKTINDLLGIRGLAVLKDDVWSQECIGLSIHGDAATIASNSDAITCEEVLRHFHALETTVEGGGLRVILAEPEYVLWFEVRCDDNGHVLWDDWVGEAALNLMGRQS